MVEPVAYAISEHSFQWLSPAVYFGAQVAEADCHCLEFHWSFQQKEKVCISVEDEGLVSAFLKPYFLLHNHSQYILFQLLAVYRNDSYLNEMK